MAIRASPKLFQRNIPNITRSLNTAIPVVDSDTLLRVSSSTAEKSIERSIGNNFEKSGNSTTAGYLDLSDGKQLFSSMSTSSLFRSLVNLHMASFEPMVDIGIWVMRSKLIENIITKKIILNVVKHTFYEHFCAGENLGEAARTLQRLWDDGLKGIIDYGLEDADDNESCDRNLNEFFKTVESTKLLPPSSVSYACVKITAICPKPLLERVSDLLRWEHKNPSFKLPWKAETLPALSDLSPLYHTLNEPEPLTPVEEEDLNFAYQRLLKLSQKCQEYNLPLLVDAEYSSVQPAIDYLTYSCMVQINRGENPIVYGTIQAYFKDAKERLLQATEAAEKMGVGYGVKLVRGAYYSSETQIANSLGFPSPIHDSIDSTHACYNECASFMINKVSNGTGAVLLATHNLHSGRVAAKAADELGVGKMNQNLQFAQLKGMADGLSFALKNAGFQVSKYLPYGPVEMIMPYLLRRAEENRGMLSASSTDRTLMRNELLRRVKSTFVGSVDEKTSTISNKN